MLDALRSQIDDCDAIIADALVRRFVTAASIAAHKKQHSIALYHPEREREILQTIGERIENALCAKYVQETYRCVLRLSRCAQMKQVFPHNIVLIGFMGSGKTTVGKYLADMSGYSYYDVDTLIEQEAGTSIPEIFSRHGEPFFRSLERQIIEKVSNVEQAVISCGGGSVLDQRNITHLKKKGKLIWLMAEPETLYNRIQRQTNRPLILDKNFEDIQKMIQTRHPLYSDAADYRLSVDSKGVSDIVDDIIKMIM